MKSFPRRQYIASLPVDAVAIPGYPNYFATPRGQIYSTQENRISARRFGLNSAGYPQCGMRALDGALKWPLVHRLVAKLFVPGDHSLTVNHKDMVKTNCEASNLEWVTLSENHHKAHAMKPEWAASIRQHASLAVIATNPETGAQHRFDSGRKAALWVGNPTAGGNISKAIQEGRVAYGFTWAKAARICPTLPDVLPDVT
jgi:hypothetical protein